MYQCCLLRQEELTERRRKEREQRLAAAEVEVAAKLAAIDQAFDQKQEHIKESFAKLQLITIDGVN